MKRRQNGFSLIELLDRGRNHINALRRVPVPNLMWSRMSKLTRLRAVQSLRTIHRQKNDLQPTTDPSIGFFGEAG